MNPSFSIYLEIMRIIATLMVFLAHGLIFYHPLAEFNEVVKLGRDGVIIFFVLSGFVITWCANERDQSVMDFAINRASRIYSVAIPGIILGVAASLFVSYHAGQNIAYPLNKPWLYLPMYLTFTGNFWLLSETPPGNFPYWSLNFEVWYYIIFAAFYYIRSLYRWPVIFCLLILVGPGVLGLFPLWITGSLLYYLRNRIKLPISMARLTLALTLALFVLAKIYALDNIVDRYNDPLWNFILNAESGPKQLLGDYLLGLIVALNFIAAANAKLSFNSAIKNRVRYLASFSFSCYLFHIPIFTVAEAIIPYNNSLPTYFLVIVCASIFIILLAKQTEHRKGAYRTFFYSLTRQWRNEAIPTSHKDG